MAIIKLTHIHSEFEEDKPNDSVEFRLMSFWAKNQFITTLQVVDSFQQLK